MLEIHGLVKSYNEHRALQGLNLHLEKGEIYGLLGQEKEKTAQASKGQTSKGK